MKSSNLQKNANRSTTSKLRWKIISSALKGQLNNNKNQASIRQFSSFGLFDKKEIADEKNKLINNDESIEIIQSTNEDDKWFFYSLSFKDTYFQIKLKFTSNKIPIQELFNGFDNTGNFLWPSEEILSYFCLKNSFLFDHLNVCELGCGMSGFAGLSVALQSKANLVLLTDGNKRCMQNVNEIVKENQKSFNETIVKCKQFKWRLMSELNCQIRSDTKNDDDANDEELKNKFDVILCSDCLYFEKQHLPLIETIYNLLNANGTALITAPLRQKTFKDFMKLSCKYFHLKIHIVYDSTVWQLNRKFQKELTDIYKTDLHYPLMAILSKRQTII